jgi:hypothetical protein
VTLQLPGGRKSFDIEEVFYEEIVLDGDDE